MFVQRQAMSPRVPSVNRLYYIIPPNISLELDLLTSENTGSNTVCKAREATTPFDSIFMFIELIIVRIN